MQDIDNPEKSLEEKQEEKIEIWQIILRKQCETHFISATLENFELRKTSGALISSYYWKEKGKGRRGGGGGGG